MSLRNSTSVTNTAQGKFDFIKFWRCDNHYVIPAETPEDKGKLVIEFEQERGFEHKMFKDDREKDRNLSLMWVNSAIKENILGDINSDRSV